jgi:Zn finger protein HypA/HybF involved in hydrogenase expression
MTDCTHNTLELLPEKKSRLRCRHCHLTITAAELGGSYCPECFEIHSQKRYDFDKIKTKESGPARYRCEACGVIIESE